MHNRIAKIRIFKDDSYILVFFMFMSILSRVVMTNKIYFVIVDLVLGLSIILKFLVFDQLKKYLLLMVIPTILFYFSYNIAGNDFLAEHIISISFFLPYSLLIYKGDFSKSFISKVSFIIECSFLFLILVQGNKCFFWDMRNPMSAYLLLFVMPLFIPSRNGEKTVSSKILIFHSSFILLIGFLLSGRGGIICFGVLLIGLLIAYFMESTDFDLSRLLFSFCLVLVLFVLFVYVLNNIDSLQVVFSRFYEKGGTSDVSNEPRYIMIMQYLENLNNFSNIFFGVNAKNCSLIYYFNNNPHNSYINIHMKYGLIALLIVIIAIVREMFYSFKEKKISWLFFVMAVSIRVFTDMLMGGAILDVFVYYLILKHLDGVKKLTPKAV